MDSFQGNPVRAGDSGAAETRLSIVSYDPAEARFERLSKIDELPRDTGDSRTGDSGTGDSKISWINISGLKDAAAIKRLGERYGIHPLTVEDILHTAQQPKIEVFENYRFLSMKTIRQEKKSPDLRKKPFSLFRKKEGRAAEINDFSIDQVSMIVFENAVITFQEIRGDSFDGIRKKILDGAGGFRKMGTDYLAYSIIDAVVDEYSLALGRMEEDIENFEDRAAKTSDETFLENIQETKKYLLHMKQAISPLRDNITAIIRREFFFRTDDLKPFLQDLSEHLGNAVTMVESYREWLTNIMNVNLSVLTYHMNKVMKVLAIISTLFIPLSFIAGIYGMNFDVMPELRQELGYPIALGAMGLIAAVMLVFFKIRRWF